MLLFEPILLAVSTTGSFHRSARCGRRYTDAVMDPRFHRLEACGHPALRLAPHVAAAALFILQGCSSVPGPTVLNIPAASYSSAFDAAVEAAREDGMPPVVRDRRAGVIETEPRIAGSILEPWRNDNSSVEQAVENTVSFLRRRARFEFAPVGFQPAADSPWKDLTGPDVVQGDQANIDLTQAEGELELRVFVFIEQAHTVGVRR